MPLTFDPSGTALKTNLRILLHGPGEQASVNTVRHASTNAKIRLDHAKRKPFISNTQKHLSGPELICDGQTQSGTECRSLTSPHFRLFLEIMDVESSELKRKRTIQIVAKHKSQHLWPLVRACVSGHDVGNLHICEGNVNAEQYRQVLENICCHPGETVSHVLHVTTACG